MSLPVHPCAKSLQILGKQNANQKMPLRHFNTKYLYWTQATRNKSDEMTDVDSKQSGT